MIRTSYRHTDSFTLIELLIVIAIIGILAALIIVSLTQANNQAKYQTMRDQMNEMASAANMWFLNEGGGLRYAPDVGPNQAPAFVPKYLASWPLPPYSGETYDWDNWASTSRGGTGGVGTVTIHERNSSGTAQYTWCIYEDPGVSCSAAGGTIVNTQ